MGRRGHSVGRLGTARLKVSAQRDVKPTQRAVCGNIVLELAPQAGIALRIDKINLGRIPYGVVDPDVIQDKARLQSRHLIQPPVETGDVARGCIAIDARVGDRRLASSSAQQALKHRRPRIAFVVVALDRRAAADRQYVDIRRVRGPATETVLVASKGDGRAGRVRRHRKLLERIWPRVEFGDRPLPEKAKCRNRARSAPAAGQRRSANL